MSGTHDRLAGTTLRERTAAADTDERRRGNMARAVDRFTEHRVTGLAELVDADELRHAARGVRSQVLGDLPALLERFADTAMARGAHVCWASTGSEARSYVTDLVRRHRARRVVKSKSTATEEIDLDSALEGCGAEVVETDLGEWIVQLADEAPSHIIAPALHRDRQQIHDLFVERAQARRSLGTRPDELVGFAREKLRTAFLEADVGITGANLAVADTGSIVLVTNEGNGRLVTALPRVHVVLLGMERLAADWQQADLLLSLLARSATGQRLSSYTSVVTGPRGHDEVDGPDELHIVVLDNGRSATLAGEHPEAAELANESMLCGACMDACPVEIPLQDMLFAQRRQNPTGAGRTERTAWRLWAAAWSDARRYGISTRATGWGRWATPLAGHLPVVSAWTAGRELPAPAEERFRDRWWKGMV